MMVDYVFTTDEHYQIHILAAYDVSDMSNIQEVDRIQSNPGSNYLYLITHMLMVTFLSNSHGIETEQ